MISISFAKTTMRFGRVSLLLATSACLTACSPLLADVNQWAGTPMAQQEPPLPNESLPASEVKTASLPDMPPDLVKCIDRKAKDGKTADEKVANHIKTAEERRACMKAMLAFYRNLQKAEKERKRQASADPPIRPLTP